jgi:hypothetical protein
LKNFFEVQQFLSFGNYYRQFILRYSGNTEQLTRLTKKDEPFILESEQHLAFQPMKTACITAPALQHFNNECEEIIETNASHYVSAGVLSQCDDDVVLHPVAYFSKKHIPAECNYDIYDKELMVIIKVLEQWRPQCQGAAYPIQLITDYKNLQ